MNFQCKFRKIIKPIRINNEEAETHSLEQKGLVGICSLRNDINTNSETTGNGRSNHITQYILDLHNVARKE